MSRLASGATPLARWPPLSLSQPPRAPLLTQVKKEAGSEGNGYVFGGSGHAAVLSPREMCAIVDLRWMAHTCLGSFRPRWVERKSAQAFAMFYQSACKLDQTGISRWANFGLRIFKCFSSFFPKQE
jgi:hypothetical protein